jgi:hypothetical protein
MLQSEAGYIDARPHVRQIDETLLQRTAGPYIWVIKPRRRSGPGVGPCPQYLRSRRNFMHRTEMTRSARIGRAQMQQTTCADAPLFDHVVGNAEQRRRHGEAERSGSLVVDDQLEFARLHHRQVARLGTLENAAGICADLTTRAGLAP